MNLLIKTEISIIITPHNDVLRQWMERVRGVCRAEGSVENGRKEGREEMLSFIASIIM